MTNVPLWYKSSYSTNQDTCVEVAGIDGNVGVRDGKNPTEPVLTFSASQWAAFQQGVKQGQFDLI